jgi:AcrR family transcriptional regulator
MIEAAWLLIAERGLEGMSTREVLAHTGAPRASVYHYFPRGRTELIEQAIDHSQAWMDEQIGAIQARTPAEVPRPKSSPDTSASGGGSWSPADSALREPFSSPARNAAPSRCSWSPGNSPTRGRRQLHERRNTARPRTASDRRV